MPPERRTVSSGAPWEESVGYARAVRLGSAAEAYRQAKQALEMVRTALEEAGARLEDVIRTRMYVTNIQRDSAAVGQAHREVFGTIRPATSMVEVARLIDKKMLVEIEAEAVVRPSN